MGRVEAGGVLSILAVALAIPLAGCALSGKPKTTAAAVPPQPKPVAQPKAPLPVEPLSVPQTQVQLPPPQPVNPDALTPAPPPQPAEPAVAPRPVRRTTPAPPQPKPETAAPQTAQPPEPERPPIQELVPADEQKRDQESADAHKREIRQLLVQARARRLTSEQNKMVKRIQAFVTQSDDAEKRGDMRQADALADRGLVLAKELAGGK
jgi:hypothetical protein